MYVIQTIRSKKRYTCMYLSAQKKGKTTKGNENANKIKTDIDRIRNLNPIHAPKTMPCLKIKLVDKIIKK